jgi:hypothetical protein
MRPMGRIPYVHVIKVGIEHDIRSLSSTPIKPYDTARLVTSDFVIAQFDHLGTYQLRDFFLRSRQARCSNQLLQKLNAGI